MNKCLFLIYALALIICFGILTSAPAQSPVPDGAEVDKIASGYQFVEGPLWREPGYLIFSDINGNTIYKWSPVDGKGIFYTPSGNSNGLAVDLQGRVLMAQHGKRQIARVEDDGTETPLATHFDSKRLNSPNDLTVKSDGSIWFTDPPYGINSSQKELGFYGIFRLSTNGELILLDNSLSRPNGIAFSPDETKLYVNDSQARKIYVWDIQPDLTLANKKLFATMSGSGSADGMEMDCNGNLYSSGPGGVWIYQPDGTLLDKIAVPEQTTNVAWGDSARNTLYITSGTSIYSITLNATGVQTGINKPRKTELPDALELFGNFPNPFNPVTTITFTLSKPEQVGVQIVNIQGELARSWDSRDYDRGTHNLVWNACDVNGVAVASGVYYCLLTSGSGTRTLKMLLLR